MEKEFKPKRDADDPSSTSEAEESDVNGDDGAQSNYYCRHCFTTDSKDWHHAGKSKNVGRDVDNILQHC
jgi:hypothetical protein